MKKIPTMFDRDWNGDRSRVVNKPHPDCGWVFAGEGRATRKLDGTCCMVRDGKLYKRRELKASDKAPADFEIADYDEETKKTVGWVPVGENPEDRWHREAWERIIPEDGTYELIGPKIQGNPEKFDVHALVSHHSVFLTYDDVPRDFESLKRWLAAWDIEGLVFQHPDGRMAKIKLRDFGLKRGASVLPPTERADG
jgi:hypothetical protein